MGISVYEVVTEKIIERLKAGTVPWAKPWSGTSRSMPKNLKSGKEYRGINVWILACQGYASPWWVTFKQAQERGGTVRKGQHGCPVVFWNWVDKKDPETKKVIPGKKVPFLRYYTVFNAEQCEGLDVFVPPPAVPLIEWDNVQAIIGACETIVNGYKKSPVIYEEEHGDIRAWYSPSRDVVNVPKRGRFKGPEEYYTTLFHELGHSTGHTSRLDRSSLTNVVRFGCQEYSKEELVAEMTAAFLCGTAGVEATLDNSAAYIAGWLKSLKDDEKMIVQAAAQAQRAADLILGKKFEDKNDEAEPSTKDVD